MFPRQSQRDWKNVIGLADKDGMKTITDILPINTSRNFSSDPQTLGDFYLLRRRNYFWDMVTNIRLWLGQLRNKNKTNWGSVTLGMVIWVIPSAFIHSYYWRWHVAGNLFQ